MSRNIEENIIKLLRPSSIQLKFLNNVYLLIKKKLTDCLSKRQLDAIVEPEGSFAKNTLLSDKWELDIFILFKNVSEEWIINNSEEFLRECLKGFPISLRYAQHPYITVHLMGIQADVVPAKLIEKPIGTLGVDRTPFHTSYIRRKIGKKPRLADEIRLLKSFFKGIGTYGAESSIGGFSGYLAELLVVYYGSFKKVLEEASKWRPGVFLDIEGIGNEKLLKRKYKNSVMIVVDPVDPERNAAAAVTFEKFSTFILSARAYLRKPCKTYFHIYAHERKKVLEKKEIRDILPRTVILYFEGDYEYLSKDSLLGKLKRLETYIANALRLYGFKVVRHKFYTDEITRAAIFFELESFNLPEVELLEGPYSWDLQERTLRFLVKRSEERGSVWISKDGKLIGVRKRRFVRASDLIIYVLESAPKMKFTRSFKVLRGDEAKGWLHLTLTSFISEVPVWMSCL